MKDLRTADVKVIEAFQLWVEARPSAKSTARSYARDIRHVYMLSGGEVDQDALTRYFSREEADQPRKFRVANAWRAWEKFNTRSGRKVPTVEYAPKRQRQKIKDSLEPEDYDRCIEAAKEMGDAGKRALLLCLTGMRRSTACEVRVKDVIVRNERRYLALRREIKGGDEHLIPIKGHLAELVNSLVAGKGQDEFLLRGSGGKRLSPNAIYVAVQRLGKKAKVKDLHPHRLRHGFADWLRRSGVDIVVIQHILGHKDIATTQRYFRVSHTDLDKVGEQMDAYFPEGK